MTPTTCLRRSLVLALCLLALTQGAVALSAAETKKGYTPPSTQTLPPLSALKTITGETEDVVNVGEFWRLAILGQFIYVRMDTRTSIFDEHGGSIDLKQAADLLVHRAVRVQYMRAERGEFVAKRVDVLNYQSLQEIRQAAKTRGWRVRKDAVRR